MGLFKVLGFAALGVGAVAAAPFTGGGSILGAASLAGSLAGAGVTATAAGVTGAVIGAASSDIENDELEDKLSNARAEGHAAGFEKGAIETKKKLLAFFEKDEVYRLGTFALAVYVAALDGMSNEEKEYIEKIIGMPDSIANKTVRERMYAVYLERPNFITIQTKYLSKFNAKDIEELNTIVDELIRVDGISDKELNFLNETWKPYVDERTCDY